MHSATQASNSAAQAATGASSPQSMMPRLWTMLPLPTISTPSSRSGNIVHNLGIIDWGEDAPVAAWAAEFDAWVAECIAERRHDDLVGYLEHPLGRMAAPTPDHYLPLLYTLAVQAEGDDVLTVHAGIQNGTVSMRCLQVGPF